MVNSNETAILNYPREYRYSRWMRLFIGIAGPSGIVLFIWLVVWMFVDKSTERDLWVQLFLAAVSFGMILLIVYGIVEVFRAKLILYADKMCFTEIKGERIFSLDEIGGYRITPNGEGIYLIPKDPSKKKISIPSVIEKYAELLEWIGMNFKNLNTADFKAEEEKILEDPQLGNTPEERREKLGRTRTLMKQTKWITFGITFWAMIYPRPYEAAIIAAALIPAIGMIVLINSRGLIRLDEQKDSAYPSVFNFFIPAFAIAIRALMDYNIVTFSDIVIPTGSILLIISGILFWKSKEYHAKPLKFIPVMFIMVFYSYGLVIQGNCMMDESEPVIHPVQVLEKRIDKGKQTSWYLTVSSWGIRASENEIEVSRPTYEAVNVGESVHVKEKTGSLGIHWFFTRPIPKNGTLLPVK